MAGDPYEDELPVDPLLGQPRLVADPRISIAQASVVLGKSPTLIRKYIALGRLRRHGPPRNGRPLLLSEVEALRDKGDPIPLSDAARKLGRSVEATRELVAQGLLHFVPGTKSMVYPADVAAITQKVANRPIRRPAGPDGYIDTSRAAQRLGLTARHVAHLAAQEKLNAVFQHGRWWFDPIHIELVRRARRAVRDRRIHLRPIADVELPQRSAPPSSNQTDRARDPAT